LKSRQYRNGIARHNHNFVSIFESDKLTVEISLGFYADPSSLLPAIQTEIIETVKF